MGFMDDLKKSAGKLLKKNILEAPFVQEMCRTTANMYRTRRMPSSTDRIPAATSAVYSPSEKPAHALKVTPASLSAS